VLPLPAQSVEPAGDDEVRSVVEPDGLRVISADPLVRKLARWLPEGECVRNRRKPQRHTAQYERWQRSPKRIQPDFTPRYDGGVGRDADEAGLNVRFDEECDNGRHKTDRDGNKDCNCPCLQCQCWPTLRNWLRRR
jgi:hypothetical protein